jgi:hypothetical protein
MSCCGACAFWTPTVAEAIVIGGDAELVARAQMHAEEMGLCSAFERRFPDACKWLRGSDGPFWGQHPHLGYLTHADEGKDCPAFDAIDGRVLELAGRVG